jgi:hypothetical protein
LAYNSALHEKEIHKCLKIPGVFFISHANFLIQCHSFSPVSTVLAQILVYQYPPKKKFDIIQVRKVYRPEKWSFTSSIDLELRIIFGQPLTQFTTLCGEAPLC